VASQGVDFDFTSRGADKLAADFRKTGDNAALASKGARLCADALEKQRKAADVSAGATLALAKADDILKEAEHGLAEGALEAEFALKKEAAAAKKAGVDAAVARAGFSGLAGAGGIPGGGMGAVIAAGVALSPVIATLGVGLGGLGLAAFGVAKNQKLMAAELAPLKAEFADFTKALQPAVLGVFNTGIKLAGGLLHDIQPVAQATGKAFDSFLGTIDAEFRSRTWQDFFGFMAAQAGPDMKLLAGAILPLLDTLPKLLTDIQPIAVEFLKAAGGAARLADAAVTLNEKIQHLGSQADHSSGMLGRIADAGKKALAQMLPGIPAAQALGKWLGTVGDNSDKAGKSTASAGEAFKGAWPKAQSYAQWVQASAVATTNLANAQNAAVSAQLAYGNDILTSANDAETFRQKLKASAGQIGLHTQAQRDSFGAANTYIGDLARQATAAITSGHGTDAAITAIRNGLPVLDTAKTKNKQYWQEVATLNSYLKQLELIKFINTPIHVTGTGKWSVTGTSITPGVAHGPQNIGAAPGAATGLFIDRGTGPTADDVMIRASRGELIVPAHMVRAGAVDHLRGAIPGFAAGGVAGSYGPGRVAGLPPWIGGRINATDTAISQNVAQAILNAMAAAQKAAKSAAAAIGSVGNYKPGAGVQQWRGVVRQALGLAGANVAQLTDAVLYQMQTESGGNPTIVNRTDSNWFAGHPSVGLMQVIRGTFQAYAGRYRNVGPFEYGVSVNPLANVYAAIKYAQANYGPGLRNAYGGIGSGHGYALGGIVPGYASGGVAGQGAAWLKAWQTRHGGGYGAAWGPTVLNQQIPAMAAAIQRARALSGASGLSPGQHRFWAATAADETKRLAVLGRELVTERAWRYQLGLNELGLDKQIRAAGSLPSLAGPVRGWKAQLGRDKATVAAISKMLGYSDAYIKAHPAAKPPVTGVLATHSYGGDVANNLGVVLAAALGPFTGAARGGMVSYDRGGWLRPGATMAWNGTGRPEQVIPSRGGGGQVAKVELEITGGDQELVTLLRKIVRVRGGGSVERAFGAR
jgi:hypothetical protein